MEFRHYFDEDDAVENIVQSLRELSMPSPPSIVCIGTDRSTGDSFAPFVGNSLRHRGLKRDQLIGTIDDPVHGQNLDRAKSLSYPTLAIDAGLGKSSSVGALIIQDKGITPGSAIDKEYNTVGSYCIQGIVNVSGFANLLVLGSTRLSLVIKMAETVAEALYEYVRK